MQGVRGGVDSHLTFALRPLLKNAQRERTQNTWFMSVDQDPEKGKHAHPSGTVAENTVVCDDVSWAFLGAREKLALEKP